MCEPVPCGNFTIEYPFWLGAPRRSVPEAACGHPDFELWCMSGNTTAMSGSPIHVLSIRHPTNSLVVVHNRVASGTDDMCRADFNVNATGVPGCGRNIYAYLSGSYDRDTPPAIPTGNCTYTYLLVLGLEAAFSTAADYGCLLKTGFLLDWEGTGIGDCDACVASGGQCSAATVLLSAVLTTHARNTTSCEPATCGGLRIEYPFWLGGTHPPECGYRAFQDSSFRVTNVELSDSTCDFKLQVNVSSDLGLAPFSISAANRELFFLYDCRDLQPAQQPPTWAPLNCDSNSFAWLAGGYKPDDKWPPVPGNCSVLMVPVLGYPGATGANYHRLMEGGFRLEYTTGECTACRDTGGLCRINPTYDIFDCQCPSGLSDGPLICGDQFITPAEKGSKGTSKMSMLIGMLKLLPFSQIKGKRLWFLLCKKTSSNTEKNYEAMIVSYGSLAPKRYMYSEVMKITSSRNNQLGKGGYGEVSKGRLHDDRLVAVKFLHDCKGNGDEFVNQESKLSMTGARGTIGFIAPEVHSRSFGVVSEKSDVYSYGMMLLEMVGGRRNVKSIDAKSSEKYFPDWIYDHFAQDDGLQACEVTSEIEKIARKMTLIGLWCVQILPAYRPTITKVLEMFDRSSDDMDMPPKQNFSGLL
uniref:Protein kinase domain-containing protein n=1 Tax=Triticum aestivum TaxID=4565 RepID=A0A2K4NT28_WHEAT|nr:unnamed protein product [Triticum aestivum]